MLRHDVQKFTDRFGECPLLDKLIKVSLSYQEQQRLVDRLDEKYKDNIFWFDIRAAYNLYGTYKNEVKRRYGE